MYLAEVENNVTEEAIDQIIDWIDKDSNPFSLNITSLFMFGGIVANKLLL